jgi:molecular chaperone HtpG
MLLDLYRNERADYESKWDDLKIFVQYGLLSDEKFAEKAVNLASGENKDGESGGNGFYLFKNVDNKYYGINDYITAIKDTQTDKDGKTVFLYTSDSTEQYAYVESAKAKGYDVLVMNSPLDTPFFNYIEQKNDKVRFVRVDSEIAAKLVPTDNDAAAHGLSEDDEKTLREIFTAALPAGNVNVTDGTAEDAPAPDLSAPRYSVEFSALGAAAAPAVITRSEFMRRMKEMSEIQPMMNFYGKMGEQISIVINADNSAVQRVLKTSDKEVAGQIIDLALLSNGLLKGEALAKFLRRSANLLEK